jgi:hypothetical protein
LNQSLKRLNRNPRNRDKRFILLGNLDLGAQSVERQAAHEIVGDVGAAFEPEGVGAVSRDQEIEQDLALRRKQRGGFRFARFQRIEIGCDDVL